MNFLFDTSIDVNRRQFYVLAMGSCIGNLAGFIGNALIFGWSGTTIFCGICMLLMVAGSTILIETIVYLYTSARYLIPFQILGFTKIVLIEVVFNILLTIILYPLIRKTGCFLEDTFKKRKILTKYF